MSNRNAYFCCRTLFSISLGLMPMVGQAAKPVPVKPVNPRLKNVDYPKRIFVFKDQWLKLEWNADSVLHFEFGKGTPPDENSNIYVSPLFANAELPGPQTFNATARTFTTKEMKVEVSSSGDCFDVTDIARGQRWTHICAPDYTGIFQLTGSSVKPSKLLGDWKVFPVQTYGVKDAYGLGQLFGDPNSMDIDRLGKMNDTHGDYGNMMASYAGGAVGETFFPVIYGLGTGSNAFLFAMDNIYKQRWDLSNDLWRIGTFGDTIRGYVVVGPNPLELRRRFMAMSGRMALPPKKLFGYWMSEYGYEKWSQVDEKLQSMRADRFPIDGFFLDLQWFGNVRQGSDYTAMGKLTFDESNFPDPVGRIAAYRKQGIGLIPIEESYVGKALNEFRVLGDKGYLAHDCGSPTKPTYLTGANTGNTSEWWGRGGMMDWSNPEGAAFWHDTKRQKLVNMGIMGHWLDLGEPEMFDRNSCYHGAFETARVHHQDVHNIYSLLWAKSVADGYARNKVVQRPFSMLRSGNIGLQHYGAGLWSGDIGGNTESLTAHTASHNHLSWSGIDLYSSDIGGFHRNRANGQPLNDLETQETFTQWFANATWFDIPVRSHVMNLEKDRETAPNRIGHIESNRANLRQRYALTPYYYSLAWSAYTNGTPIFTPMAMAYPADLRFRQKGDQMLLGDLLIGAASERGVYFRDINLPAGSWYDLRDGTYRDVINAQTAVVGGVPMYRNGLFQLPVYVREGALIPQNIVDENTLGSDNRVLARGEDAMKLSVFVANDNQNHEFVMYEDDGQTTAYQTGAVRYTKFSQKTTQHRTTVTIDGAVGNFAGQSTRRGWIVNLYAPTAWGFSALKINGTPVTECKTTQTEPVCVRRPTLPGSKAEILIGMNDVRRRVVIEAEFNAATVVTSSVHFVCQDSETTPRYSSMFIAGSDPKLGSWDLTKAIPMTTNGFLHGIWTAEISGLPPKTAIEWKCVKIPPQSSGRGVEWQPGNNNQFNSGDGGFLGISRGGFGRH